MSTVIQTLPHTPAAGATPTVAVSSVPVAPRADVVVAERITIPGWIRTLDDYRDWAESDDYPRSGWVSYLDGEIWVDPGADVIASETITIPGWIRTLDDFRDWAESDDYPQSGWVSYLDGQIWVDPSMEEFLTHNAVKQAFNYCFGSLLQRHPVGRFVPDRMFFANPLANLTTEPDGLFYLWETMKSGRLRMVPRKKKKTGYVQLEGTPDGILEVLSDGSEKKDLNELRDLYWKAQIPEYWLVDARKDTLRFEILRHTPEAYVPSVTEDGWVRSEILQHSFRIERTSDPLGLDDFIVHVKE